MKITKLLALTAALAVVGAAQAEDIHWYGTLAGGDETWENSSSWYNAHQAGAPGLPIAADVAFINRYALNNGANDLGTSGATLNSTQEANLMIIAWKNPGTGETQEGTLSLGTGANLTLTNLQTGNDPGAIATMNMTDNASATVGGMWFGTDNSATMTLNMSGTSALTVTAGLVNWSPTSSVVMDGDSVLTIVAGSLDWATDGKINALGAGDSIFAEDIGGNFTQYTVIPEPATLGLMAMLGGGMLWVRKSFSI